MGGRRGGEGLNDLYAGLFLCLSNIGRRDSGSDLRCARQCREEGVVKIGLLPEPQAPATQRSLPSQSWTVRCVRGYSIRHGSTIVLLHHIALCLILLQAAWPRS